MALVKGTNSYATLLEADAFFEMRLDVLAWTSATVLMREQALVTATSLLDTLNWTGMAISEAQLLAFPRFGVYYEPRLGYETYLDETVPDRIVIATYELAYHLLNNDGLLDDTGTVTSLNVGQISLNIKTNPSTIPSSVRRYIAPLLKNGGANIWWRRN
jgi:hypothetical protein